MSLVVRNQSVAAVSWLLDRVLVCVWDNFCHSTRDFRFVILTSVYALTTMCVPSVAAPVSGGIGSSVELLAALRVVEETYMSG